VIYVVIAAALLGVFVVILKVMQRPTFSPKLPVVAKGALLGKFSLHHDATNKAVGLEHGFPPSELGRFVVFYVDDLLFYYGNGSKQYDQSERLRDELRKNLKGSVPPIWRFDPAARADAAGGTLTGELYEAGFSASRVVGWQKQDECRVGGISALLAYALMLPDAPRTRQAVAQLIRWQEEFGPMPSLGNSARAHAAFNGIQPLP
jgi:hypothetical protein